MKNNGKEDDMDQIYLTGTPRKEKVNKNRCIANGEPKQAKTPSIKVY